MSMVIFDARGSIAHFRRPDTLGTHASYPFITRTALSGLAASILGRDSLPDSVRFGIQLLTPVSTVTQQLNLHGRAWVAAGPDTRFQRPTTIELVVNPAYRLYYDGEFADQLADRLRHRQSHFHTYLGSAFCLTFPQWVRALADGDLSQLRPRADETFQCLTVVPTQAIRRLAPQEGDHYARVGGVPYRHLGRRRFRGTVSLIYEVNGRPIRFVPNTASDVAGRCRFLRVSDGDVVCLW